MSEPSTTVRRHPDKPSTAAGAAEALLDTLSGALAEGRAPQIALTGGSMGSAVVAALVRHHAAGSLDWGQVGVWWGDERYLPAGDGDRNDVQADDAGLGELALDPAHIHRVGGPDVTGSAEEAAQAYGDRLADHDVTAFEVVMLGVGPDGHVASLFPRHPAQQVSDRPVVAVHDSPKPPSDRVSLTFGTINAAREVWFLVSGTDKAEAVAAALRDDTDRWEVPAAGVHGRVATRWFVDEDAAPPR